MNPDVDHLIPEAPPPAVPGELPSFDDIVIEDGQPVETIFAEKQYRLLTEPLYNGWTGPSSGQSFLVLANVGLFWSRSEPPVCPDVMLSLGVPASRDLSQKKHRSYFVEVMGKIPDVVLEIVSDTRGGEDSTKMREYLRRGIPYYVIFDPEEWLERGVLRAFMLQNGAYQPIPAGWFEQVELGLRLWPGRFENEEDVWLRWCLRDGTVIPTGYEMAQLERQRAEQERQRAEQLAARLRELGIDPEA